MRFGAFRWILCRALVVATATFLVGCSSPTKRHYLHHLSIVIPPAEPGSNLVAMFDDDRAMDPTATASGSGSDDFPFESR